MKLTRLLISLLSVSALCQAGNQAFIFGGGPNPQNSQFSIEDNVIWFQSLLETGSFTQVTTQFGSNQTVTDEIKVQSSVDPDSPFSRLAEVLGTSYANSLVYQPARIGSSNNLTTEREHLISALTDSVSQLTAGDRLLLTYSGHGGQARSSEDNYFYLWNNSRLSVRDLAAVLAKADPQSQVQFIFPQCYSGAFNRLAFTDLDPDQGLRSGAAICGFTSVADDRLAEGCTASIESGDYRDYASQLFAQLTGRDRAGMPVSQAKDLNNDGAVSLLEAHYAVYASGNSTDIPRATSETFLINTETWQQRFVSYQASQVETPYSLLLTELTPDFDSRPGSKVFLQESKQRMAEAERQLQELQVEMRRLHNEANTLRKTLKEQLLLRWPQLAQPATMSFVQTVNSDIQDIDLWLAQQSEMAELWTAVEQLQQMSKTDIELNRERSRQMRIQRAIKLNRLHATLYATGSEADQATYEALLACEDQPIPGFR